MLEICRMCMRTDGNIHVSHFYTGYVYQYVYTVLTVNHALDGVTLHKQGHRNVKRRGSSAAIIAPKINVISNTHTCDLNTYIKTYSNWQ